MVSKICCCYLIEKDSNQLQDQMVRSFFSNDTFILVFEWLYETSKLRLTVVVNLVMILYTALIKHLFIHTRKKAYTMFHISSPVYFHNRDIFFSWNNFQFQGSFGSSTDYAKTRKKLPYNAWWRLHFQRRFIWSGVNDFCPLAPSVRWQINDCIRFFSRPISCHMAQMSPDTLSWPIWLGWQRNLQLESLENEHHNPQKWGVRPS